MDLRWKGLYIYLLISWSRRIYVNRWLCFISRCRHTGCCYSFRCLSSTPFTDHFERPFLGSSIFCSPICSIRSSSQTVNRCTVNQTSRSHRPVLPCLLIISRRFYPHTKQNQGEKILKFSFSVLHHAKIVEKKVFDLAVFSSKILKGVSK